MDKKRKLQLVCLVSSAMTTLASAQKNMQSNVLLGPTIQEFGYQSVAQVLNDLDNLQAVTNPMVIETGKWSRLRNDQDLTGQEYYLVTLKTGKVYFVVSGFGRSVHQTFGPLSAVLPCKE